MQKKGLSSCDQVIFVASKFLPRSPSTLGFISYFTLLYSVFNLTHFCIQLSANIWSLELHLLFSQNGVYF